MGPGVFAGLSSLTLLDLRLNQIVLFLDGAFRELGSLQQLHRGPRLPWLDGLPPPPGHFTCRPALIRKSGPRWVMAEEGGHAVFSCSGDGDPAPTVSWMRPQGVRLGKAGRVRVLQDGTLEIRSVQLRDRGAYVCVVSNVAGNDSLRTWLEVIQVEPPNGTLSDPNITLPGIPGPFFLDSKGIAMVLAVGFLPFLTSVTLCFGLIALSAVLMETPDAEVEWEEKMLTASECASKRGQSSVRKSGDAESSREVEAASAS